MCRQVIFFFWKLPKQNTHPIVLATCGFMYLLPASLVSNAVHFYSVDLSARRQRYLGTKLRTLKGKMSICTTLGMILSRSIHALDMKKKEKKQQQNREQQRLSEQSDGSVTIQSGQEYQHLGGHEHSGEEALRDSDHDHTHHRDGRNDSFAHRTVAPSLMQTFDWLETEVVNPLEDTPPIYDHNATRLPPYDHGSVPRRGRRHRESRASVARNGAQINEPRAGGACTAMRVREHPGLDVNRGAVIWYDALEDRYEVISRSLASPTEPPLPPPYMPNSCLFT